MKTKLLLFIPLFLLFSFVSCNEDETMDEAQFKSFNKPGKSTIYEIAVTAGFNQLAGAIVYVDGELNAGLLETIQSNETQLTVFAPTDQAFANLLSFLDRNRDEDIDDITDIPAEIVLAVLQYHLTEGRRGSNSVVPSKKTKTIQTFLPGASFQVDNQGVITDAAGFTSAIGSGTGSNVNVSASNGMVHEVGAVLLPLAPADILALWDSLIEE